MCRAGTKRERVALDRADRPATNRLDERERSTTPISVVESLTLSQKVDLVLR